MRQAIRDARKARDLTVEEAAKLAGISKPYWSRIENDKQTPSVDVIAGIVSILGADAKVLFPELNGKRPADEEGDHG